MQSALDSCTEMLNYVFLLNLDLTSISLCIRYGLCYHACLQRERPQHVAVAHFSNFLCYAINQTNRNEISALQTGCCSWLQTEHVTTELLDFRSTCRTRLMGLGKC